MRIIRRLDAVNISKPEGTNVSYFLFDEYELHYNEQVPGSTQTWHHHEVLQETLFIIEGELTALWREDGKEKSQVVSAGDVIESERTPHTFLNHTDRTVKFLVLKRISHGENNRDIFKTDKVVDQERA